MFRLGVPHAKDDDPSTDDVVDPPGPFTIRLNLMFTRRSLTDFLLHLPISPPINRSL